MEHRITYTNMRALHVLRQVGQARDEIPDSS